MLCSILGNSLLSPYVELEAAYTNQINAKPPRKPLITLSQYNYLMESDPFMTVIGNEGDYQV